MQFTLLPSAVARAGNVEVWRMDPCPGAATAEATRRTNCDVLSLHIAVNKLAGWVCGTNWGTLQFVSEVHRQQAQAQKLSKHVYMPQLTGICNKDYIFFRCSLNLSILEYQNLKLVVISDISLASDL